MSNTHTVQETSRLSDECSTRAEELLRDHQQTIYVRTDRMFGCLMVLQFLGGVVTAYIVSPLTWAGSASEPHIHVWAAIFLGGALTILPLSLVIAFPGKAASRHVIGICQMLMSALLIHLSGGRIETHFHVFGSLAFLAVYRDWRVLLSATIVVATDHVVRGIFWPQSVYGVLTATPWRSLEHAAWVIFEDVFLIVAIRQNVLEMKQVALHRARLEMTNTLVEAKVKDRTAELEQVNRDLEVEIAERHRAEKEANSRQERLRAIFESAGEGIVTIDAQGVIESLNAAAARMFGYREDELVGQNVSLLIPPPEGKQHENYIESCLRTDRDVEGKRKDDSLFPLELAVSEVHIAGMHLFTAIIRDLTHQKQLQCELAQAQKLESVGQLAAGIAHEINTPIQYVGDNTRFLEEAFGGLDTAWDGFDKLLQAAKEGHIDQPLLAEVEAALLRADIEYLREEVPLAIEQSLSGIGRVAKIVRAMKEFSHPGAEEKCLVNLADALETTITVARNEWKYVAEMVTEFDPELPEVSCLPGELNQVFLNLIVNAAHAIGDALGEVGVEKGTITVGTRRHGERAEVFVRDTGIGIPKKIQDRIFDPFFTTKEVGKGTGQGLAIARSVVDKHGGTIHCESTEGQGTTFFVRLPLKAQENTVEAHEYENTDSLR